MVQCQSVSQALTGLPVNKWEILRLLRDARKALGVSDRELSVLQALLSFYPDDELDPASDLVIFPSNAKICERLNGMPCSTMRRHLGRLVQAGLLVRRDSPNGKRFVSRGGDAFGFDLSPLPRRYGEFFDLATTARAEAIAYDTLRRRVSLLRRDLAGLVSYGLELVSLPLWDQLNEMLETLGREFRRKLSFAALEALAAKLEPALKAAKSALESYHQKPAKTEISSTSIAQNEQHQHKSNKDSHVSKNGGSVPNDLPLALVTTACPSLRLYGSEKPLRNWEDLYHTVRDIYPMMGISENVWTQAVETMGRQKASTVVAAMLERFKDLRSPSAYLRSLTTKEEAGKLSVISMVLALINRTKPGVHNCEQGLCC